MNSVMIIADDWSVGFGDGNAPAAERAAERYVQFHSIGENFAMRELVDDDDFTSAEKAFGEFIAAEGRVELWLDRIMYTKSEIQLLADNLGANCIVYCCTAPDVPYNKHYFNNQNYPIVKLIKTA